MSNEVTILEFSLLNREERIPVLNGNLEVNKLDHERMVALAELIVLENNVPFCISDDIFGEELF